MPWLPILQVVNQKLFCPSRTDETEHCAHTACARARRGRHTRRVGLGHCEALQELLLEGTIPCCIGPICGTLRWANLAAGS